MADVYDGYTYLSQTFPTLPYIVEKGIMPMAMKAVLFGEQKKGKSAILNQLAIAVVHGKDWFGFKTNKKRILYMNFEIGHPAWQYRLRKYCRGIGVSLSSAPGELAMVSNLMGVRLDTSTGQAEMEKLVAVHAPNLLILDPFKKVLSKSANDEECVMAVTDFLDKLIFNYGVSVWICHHTRKSKITQSGIVSLGAQEMTGTLHLAQWVDSLIGLISVSQDKIRLEFECRHAEDVIKPINLVLNRQIMGFEVVP